MINPAKIQPSTVEGKVAKRILESISEGSPGLNTPLTGEVEESTAENVSSDSREEAANIPSEREVLLQKNNDSLSQEVFDLKNKLRQQMHTMAENALRDKRALEEKAAREKLALQVD